MSRRRRSTKRPRRSHRALFDKLSANIKANGGAISTEQLLAEVGQTASILPDAHTSPFGRPLHSMDDLATPFAKGTLASLPPSTTAFQPISTLGPGSYTTVPDPLPPPVPGASPDPFATLKRLPQSKRQRRRLLPQAVSPPTSADNSFRPEHMGLLTWTQDPFTASHSAPLVAQTFYSSAVYVGQTMDVERIHVYLTALNRFGNMALLSAAIYNAEGRLMAEAPARKLTPASYDIPAAPQVLSLANPLNLTPGLYTVALYCSSCEGHISLLAGSFYRGIAIQLNGRDLRSAYAAVTSLPKRLGWATLQPGHNYWFGLS